MRYGILVTPNTSTKAARFLRALYDAGTHVAMFEHYQHCDVLILYGLGGPDRLPVAEKHRASGKPFIAFDLGYWGRDDKDRCFRLSINSNHPDRVMVGPSPGGERFTAVGVPMGDGFDPDGPVMLVGNSTKSRVFGTDGWAGNKSREIREAFPDKQLIYRPKPRHPIERRVRYDSLSTGPIDDALCGLSLVVCRHSNVAIDACRMGIPVVCQGGAGAAIYPKAIAEYQAQPDASERLHFLHRLAWWQYSSAESDLCWQFIEGLV